MKTLEELLTETRMPSEVSPEENPGNGLHGLRDFCEDYVTKDTVMVEVGCFVGASTELFAMHCKKIFAIDPWELLDTKGLSHSPDWGEYGGGRAVRKDFEDRMAPYDNVKIIRGFSVEASEQFEDESLDLVYVDGNHARKHVFDDLSAWYPKIKYGGILSGHDCCQVEVIRGQEKWLGGRNLMPRQPKRGGKCRYAGRGYIDGTWRVVKKELE